MGAGAAWAACPLRHGGVLTAAWALWNLGVTLGVCAILYGHGTSYEGLEFPRYVSPILFTAFVFIAVWAVLLFRERHGEQAYISQWYALAAFLWFPWVYGTANLVVFFLGTQAAVQAIVAAWYAHNVVGTFLVPLALAGAYYMVPKATGEPIYRYRWAKIGFWTWLLVRRLERGLQPDRRAGAGVDSQRVHRRDGALADPDDGHRDEPARLAAPAAGGGAPQPELPLRVGGGRVLSWWRCCSWR